MIGLTFIVEVTDDAVHVEGYYGTLPFYGLQEPERKFTILEPIFRKTSWAEGMNQQVEIALYVRITVGVVLADAVAGKMNLRCSIEGVGQLVPGRLATGSVTAPTGGIVPSVAFSGGIDVDGDQKHILLAQLPAPGVHALGTGFQADIVGLRNQQLSIIASINEVLDNAGGNEAVVGVFPEAAVGRPLPRSIDAMTIIDQDFHRL